MSGSITFGRWLKAQRKSRDLTQEELAREVGCAPTTLRMIEAEKRRPSRQLVERFMFVLQAPSEEGSALMRLARTDPLALLKAGPALPRFHGPTPVTSFVGRDTESAAVTERLADPACRMVTLLGPGGIGKTRVALHVASRMVDRFSDGVWFVNLAPLTDPALVPATIVQVLGIRDTSNVTSNDLLRNFLRQRQLLLVLDNFEHLLTGAEIIDDLLASAPNLKILVTSREIMRLQAEHQFPLAPLRVPNLQRLLQWDQLHDYDAVQLFTLRARQIQPDFQLTDGNARAVAELCVRLDGLPLAIELAAARLNVLSPQDMLKRLSSSLNLLSSSTRDRPHRQQTLRHTTDWSYSLLAPHEQRLFARLAIFVGGCTIDAVEYICYGRADQSTEVVDDIAALAKSLIQRNEEHEGAVRYTMLETLREYAAEQLLSSGQVNEIAERHMLYYTSLVEVAAPMLQSAEEGVWLDRLEHEHDNLRAALRWTITQRRADEGVRLASALGEFWIKRSYNQEGYNWLTQVLALPTTLPPSNSDAKAWYWAGWLAMTSYNFPAAQTALDRHLAIACNLADQGELMGALMALGRLAELQGNLTLARKRYDEALTVARTIDEDAPALILNLLGSTVMLQGNLAFARTCFAECLTISRKYGKKYFVSWVLRNMARTESFDGDFSTARLYLEQGIELGREIRDREGVANGLADLAEIEIRLGNHDDAKTLLDESLAIAQNIGDPHQTGITLRYLGYLAQAQQDYDTAARILEHSLALTTKTCIQHQLVEGMERLAHIATAQRKAERALQLFARAASMRTSIGAPIPPSYCAEYESSIESLRDQLGARTFTDHWAEGQNMPLDVIIPSGQYEPSYTAPNIASDTSFGMTRPQPLPETVI